MSKVTTNEINQLQKGIIHLKEREEILKRKATEASNVLEVLILANKLDRNDLEHAQDFVERPRGVIDSPVQIR